MATLKEIISYTSGYDPDALPVAKANEVIRSFVRTVAVMPAGTDTVVIQEAVTAERGRITIPPGQEPGQNRRLAGEDLQKGRPALHAGRMLRPADIGLIASLGIGEVGVRRKLKVAFFSTGDELVSVGKKLKAGEV